MINVLLAEDDEAVRFSLRIALERAGFDVSTAKDGRDALRQIKERKPDIVVTDILMPNQDGIEVLTSMRLEDPDFPVIAVSGGGRVSSEDYLNTASVLGAVAVFKKPFNEGDLISAIKTATAS